MGFATNALADAVPTYWDRGGTVNVRMTHGSLESKTEQEILNGANRAYLGGEVIAFATATLESDGTYTLTTLLRGLMNTEEVTGLHSVGSQFVLLSAGNIGFREINLSAIGTSREFTPVPAGGLRTDYVSQAHTVQGFTIRPYTVYDIRGTRNGSNDLTIDFRRRSRAITELFSDAGEPPLIEESESYEIDIPSAVPVRTISVTSSTASYTAAQQTTDGLTPGDPVAVNIYQMSAAIGRGNEASATI